MSNLIDPSFFYLKATCKEFDLFWGNCSLDDRSWEEETSDTSSLELNIKKMLDMLNKTQKDLLIKCGYSEQDIKRANNVNDFLYLKPKFILKNARPKREIVDMYLADQDALFTYSDERYWRRRVSGELLSVRCLLARDANERRLLYHSLPAWNETFPTGESVVPEEDRDLHIALLDTVFSIAAQKRMSLNNWVKKNIPSTTPSDDERMAIVNKTGLTETGERNLRKIIRFIIPDEFCRRFLSDSEAYCVAEQNLSLFQELLPEYRTRITLDFCRSFVNFVLPDYVGIVRLAQEPQYQPKHVANITKKRSVILYQLYLCRFNLLTHLYRFFCEKRTSMLDLAGITSFPLFDDWKFTTSERENAVVSAIRNYLTDIGTLLREDARNYLGSRIHWAFGVTLRDDALRPAFLLYMVICCKGNLVRGNDIPVPRQTKGPWYTGAIRDHPRQRNAQLILLDKAPSWRLCCFLE